MPALLHPILVLDAIQTQGAKPWVMHYQMAMQSLAASGQVEAGFVLLQQVGNSGLLSHSNDSCYPVFRTLLQACRLVGDFECASQLQTAVDGLGLTACACIATALLRGSMQC